MVSSAGFATVYKMLVWLSLRGGFLKTGLAIFNSACISSQATARHGSRLYSVVFQVAILLFHHLSQSRKLRMEFPVFSFELSMLSVH